MDHYRFITIIIKINLIIILIIIMIKVDSFFKILSLSIAIKMSCDT